MSLLTLFARLILKNSNVAGKIPTKDDILPGELAVNLPDHALYTKDDKENIVRLNPEQTLNSDKITDLGDIL